MTLMPLKSMATWGFVAGAVWMTPGAWAGPILSSSSGSFSMTTMAPAADGVVSLRLTTGSLFADCERAGQCTELGTWNGLSGLSVGRHLTLLGTEGVRAALTNGALDLFRFDLNFGQQFLGLNGSVGMLDQALAEGYRGGEIGSVELVIDRLLFGADGWSGGTRVELGYTLAVLGPAAVVESAESLAWPPSASLMMTSTSLVQTPEPEAWLLVLTGLAGAAYWRLR
jgi:hypothetical protein